MSYLSFLLRLWLVDDDGKPEWRASLEDPRTGNRHGFANIDDLARYLERHTRGAPEETQDSKKTVSL